MEKIQMNNNITICSVGDLMICDSPLYASIGVGSVYSKDVKNLFDNCHTLFHQADITIGNFETVVHHPKNKSLKEKQMSCSESVICDLKNAGFSVLNLANNHCMQHGVDGFEQSVKACQKYDIQPIGIKGEKPYVQTVNGMDIVFLSLCIHLEWYEPDRIRYENRIARILQMIRKLRAENKKSVIIVSVHWGDEFAVYPSNAQIALAHKMVELGANIILGHHSHVYQGIENYENGLIIYGQGNFISDMKQHICRQTAAVQISLMYENDDLKISYKLVPYYIDDNYVPKPTDGAWLKERQELLSQSLCGNRTDADYWNSIKVNHTNGHGEFKQFFMSNIKKYSPRVTLRMLWDFAGRKMKRIIGTTTDGKVSSMDPAIMKELDEFGD